MDLASYFVKIKAGEMDYFHPFYEASKKAIFYNIFALCKDYALSEDILEETYLSFLKNIDKIDNSENILGYLMRISKNLTLDYFKKNSRIILSDDIYQQGENDTYCLDQKLLLEKIHKILKKDEYKIFLLHVLGDLTFDEISKATHKPLGTILWKYNSAIKKLRKELEDEYS